MTIFILHEDPTELAKMLDDHSLNEMIKYIAEVLCNVHREVSNVKVYDKFLDTIPLEFKYKNENYNEWSKWARECKANYLWLARLLDECLNEHEHRFNCTRKEKNNVTKLYDKYFDTMILANNNVPDLPEGQMLCTADFPTRNSINLLTPFPMTVPKKYMYFNRKKLNCNYDEKREIINSYRIFYREKIRKYYKKKPSCFESKIKWTNREMPDWINL